MEPAYDSSRWKSSKYFHSGKPSTPTEVSIHYITCGPPEYTQSKGSILLIHGYPQTSYQFRKVITPLADAGFTVIAPDYRGAGQSSKPRDGFDKVTMASDLHALVTQHLKIKGKVHVVGHDIGGMIAHAYATRFPESTASLVWGECPIPGTSAYETFIREETRGGVWHFVFHWQLDLPELLTQGKEREYIKSFYDRLCVNALAISPADVDVYAHWFAQPGAMRAGFDVYRAFHRDAEDNKAWLGQKGKGKVPSLALNGDGSFLEGAAREQNEEVHETTTQATVGNSGHWIAEENPKEFVERVVRWAEKHGSN